ncbi:ankyrin repeat domain-containing protein [Legionella spiritensis]|uniref:ankyrin repeat domain-containing protein n=1 Tax=Legionella spiritensis TaxID=452 RepID=UPI000F6C3895|nr:ankyrin repeat domain-containing protein [Legionella spiritensis]VEG90956.1 ankyrin repeat protein [Legionella spiritensis]
MRFRSENERLNDPQAWMINRFLWRAVYDGQIQESTLRLMTIENVMDVLTENFVEASNEEKLQHWVGILLSHPDWTLLDLIRIATDVLEITPNDAFWGAALIGRVDLMKHYSKDCPDVIHTLPKEEYLAFRLAIMDGNLKFVNYFLGDFMDNASFNEVQRLEGMYYYKGVLRNNRGYSAFCQAAENGHLDVLNRLAKRFPGIVDDMLAKKSYYALELAFKNGHHNIVTLILNPNSWGATKRNLRPAFSLAAKYGHAKAARRLRNFTRINEFHNWKYDSRTYIYALRMAVKNGHLELAKSMISWVSPGEAVFILNSVFLWAAENGDLDVLNRLVELAPDQVAAMVAEKSCQAFKRAAENGHLNVLNLLVELAPDQAAMMVAADDYYAFRLAAENGHLDVLHCLVELAPDQIVEMVAAWNYEAFRQAAIKGHTSVVRYLLQFSSVYAHAESHWQENHYTDYVTTYTQDYLQQLDEDWHAFSDAYPDGVYDFRNDVGEPDVLRALHGYYVLRQVIRRSIEGGLGIDTLATVERLLNIPGIKELVVANVRSRRFRDEQQVVSLVIGQRHNELLRLAFSVGHEGMIQRLLAIPAIREAAERHNFYDHEAVFDLRELAQDRESSMHGLTPQEQQSVWAIEEAYQGQLLEEGGASAVVESLKQQLRDLYEQRPELSSIDIDGELYALPFDWEDMRVFIETHAYMDGALEQQIYYVYLQNHYHSAYRYLSKPNRWMADNASYVYIDQASNTRWSTFEEYLPLIAYLWLAASDESRPPMEGGMGVSERIDLFIRQLHLLNRAHNWDKSREVEKDGRIIREQYDDNEKDKPSCFSGVKRRLFQALISHPLYSPLSQATVAQFVREWARDYYQARLQDYSSDDLRTMQQVFDKAYDEGIGNPVDNPLIQSLALGEEEQEAITEAFLERFGARAKGWDFVISSTLTACGAVPDNAFVALYASASLYRLLDEIPDQEQPLMNSSGNYGFFQSSGLSEQPVRSLDRNRMPLP